jgi:hypothetical protein
MDDTISDSIVVDFTIASQEYQLSIRRKEKLNDIF